jgi:hypothetical protein
MGYELRAKSEEREVINEYLAVTPESSLLAFNF